ncbi:M20 family metallopeptidase [Streptomyces candidus]|uniref:Glutamate carboxypeptidase n=1 Tax=Streptomyces candidus TaxID=67283 RepID=A0A7X0LNY8_9ACTN|nr:M20 family metallopeptidase [Streptomyces candidus]MBB6435988.1 glutamate carboxypeptidase [Streptomyces candidus]GHH43242.1 glutamate carboxypeptidase [Streptomyces candidus]
MTATFSRQLQASALHRRAEARQRQYLADLRTLVAIDSGSYSPDGVNRVAAWFQARLERIGYGTERIALPGHRGRALGDVLIARRQGALPTGSGGRRILLAGHMDTVFEDGTALARPFQQAGALAHGPGVSDDKGGLLAGLTALEILQEAGFDQYAELVLLATPDEEIGSPSSSEVVRQTARGTHYALALECARENGDVVIARKGVADFLITVQGRAAHAGIEPERGAHAALAAAHLTLALQALNGQWAQATVNVGVVRAGTRANIVPPHAELHIEVRAASAAALHRIRAAIHALASRTEVPGTTAHVQQLDLCPPMEDTPASRRMFHLARCEGRRLGLDLGAAATGGVGDANTIAGAGVPVLDGLGPVGGADHTPEEWLDTDSVAPRIALLASLIVALGEEREPPSATPQT